MCHCQDPQGASPLRTTSPLSYAEEDADEDAEGELAEGTLQVVNMSGCEGDDSDLESYVTPPIAGDFPLQVIKDGCSSTSCACAEANVPLPESPGVSLDDVFTLGAKGNVPGCYMLSTLLVLGQ